MTKFITPSMCLAVLLLSVTAGRADEFTYDFATDAWQPQVFRAVGTKATPPGKQTKEGMLLQAPDATSNKSQVGYASRFAISGDFEITIGFQLLDVPRPETGYGSGLIVTLFKTNNERINFSCSLKTDGEKKISTALWKKEKSGWKPHVERIPSAAEQGELKLIRKGATLTFLVKENDALEYTQVRQAQFGTEPITRMEILADTGGDQQPLKTLLTSLSMNADKLPHSAAAIPEPQGLLASSWVLYGGIAGIVLVLAGTFVWYQRR